MAAWVHRAGMQEYVTSIHAGAGRARKGSATVCEDRVTGPAPRPPPQPWRHRSHSQHLGVLGIPLRSPTRAGWAAGVGYDPHRTLTRSSSMQHLLPIYFRKGAGICITWEPPISTSASMMLRAGASTATIAMRGCPSGNGSLVSVVVGVAICAD